MHETVKVYSRYDKRTEAKHRCKAMVQNVREHGLPCHVSFTAGTYVCNCVMYNVLHLCATKYPNIAKDYFYNKKHQTVEIVKLNGSIELAPIVGLSEVIVDIVETGSTLKENGLVVLEEVCPLSARMIVNPVSMRMENDRIKELITNLRNLLREE